MQEGLSFYQFFETESSTYTYLLGDAKSRSCVLIDSVVETVERDMRWVKELGFKLLYVIDTHIHADHITAASILREKLGAKTAVSAASSVPCADILLKDGENLQFGDQSLLCLATPGHTDTCMSYFIAGMVFTGDSLMIRGTGRTDFQQGSSERLYRSIHEKLFTLADDTKVYPAHDYNGQTSSTIGLEKKFNPRVGAGRSLADFVKIMAELKLAQPKKIDLAVPANMNCGVRKMDLVLKPTMQEGIPIVSPAELFAQLGKVTIIDVRRPEEFRGELGHIEGAQLVTLGADLIRYLQASDPNQELVFVCRSGARSGQACLEAMRLNFKALANMSGGMLRWNEEALPLAKG